MTHNSYEIFYHIVSQMTTIWWILTWALEILKIFIFIDSFFAMYITFDLKMSTGVIFHDPEEWCKIWRKTDVRSGKNIKNMVNFHQSTWSDAKFKEKLTWGLENNIRNMVNFHQSTWSNAEFEEKLTWGLENNIRNMVNFHQSMWMSQIWGFDGILLSKVNNVWT